MKDRAMELPPDAFVIRGVNFSRFQIAQLPDKLRKQDLRVVKIIVKPTNEKEE